MNRNKIVIAVIVVLSVWSCAKDADFSSFRSAMEYGGDFGKIEVSQTETETGETETQEGDDIITCTTTNVSVKDALGGQNNFSLFSPNADVIFPGNLLQGKSLKKATPDEILASRAGGEITISLFDGSKLSSVEVDKISIGSVTQAANKILEDKDANSVIPANFNFTKSLVQSEEEFALRIKADYENAWASISGSLSFSSKSSYSRMMVTLEQTFYTLTYSPPYTIDGFFAEDADPEDLRRFIGPGNPACYIKSVNYGRIFYMLVESSASESDLKAAVEGSFSSLTNSGGGSVEVDRFKKIDEVNIKIFALGGDAAITLGAAGLNKSNLHKLNDILAKATNVLAGVPISYKAQSVLTNEVVAVQLATDYEKRNCTFTSALPAPVATEHWTGIYDMLGGPVGAIMRLDAVEVFQNAEIPQLFYHEDGIRCVLDHKGKLHGPYPNFEAMRQANFPNSTMKQPLDDISAGCTSFMPKVGTKTKYKEQFWIDKRGNRYAVTGDRGPSSGLIGNHEMLKFFETEGIGAMADYYPFGIITVNKPGTMYYITPHVFEPTDKANPVSDLTGGADSNKFLDGISAITRLDDFLFATVDKAGKRYMVVDYSNGPRYFGPFKL